MRISDQNFRTLLREEHVHDGWEEKKHMENHDRVEKK